MRYDLSDNFQAAQAKAKFGTFLQNGSVIELTEKRSRTLSQNAYLHVCLGCVALELGESMDYVKRQYFKLLCNGDLFIRQRHDKILQREVKVLRSSADLTKEEMSIALDRFLSWSAEQGIYLPSPDEKEVIFAMQNEIERNKRYLRNA